MSMSPLVDKVGIQSWFEHFPLKSLEIEQYHLAQFVIFHSKSIKTIALLYLKAKNKCNWKKKKPNGIYEQDL